MRHWLFLATALSAFSFSQLASAGEAVELIELKELPGGADKEEEAFLKKKRDQRQGVFEQRNKDYDAYNAKVKELEAQRKKVLELGSGTVTIDEDTKQVPEPANVETALDLKKPLRDPYEVSPDDFSIYEHDRWSINQSDFTVSAPQYITVDTTAGKSKTYFGFVFGVTNSTPKNRRISPMFTAITNKGVFNNSVGGFLPERIMAGSMGRPLGNSDTLADKELLGQNVSPLEPQYMISEYKLNPEGFAAELSPMSTFQPGQTRWGTALWTNFTNEFTELTIVVHGLTNAHRYDEKMRRVLVLTYTRNDDEFHVHRTQLKLKDRKWAYAWMWDQSVAVPIPADAKAPQLKVETIKTPAGGDKLAWAFPFVITNGTTLTQSLAIHNIGYVCPVEIDIGGAKVSIEAKINDDGRSSIYKSQLIKALGKESTKDRYALNKDVGDGSKTELERRTFKIEAGRPTDELWAVFDEADVDWDDVRFQVETLLSGKIDRKAAGQAAWDKAAAAEKADPKIAAKNPGYLYSPARGLTDEEFKSVQEQVKKGLAGALDAAKAKKTVTAYFTCTSGMSTGTYRVSRSYRQPGVVQEEWLKAWEDLDKAPKP